MTAASKVPSFLASRLFALAVLAGVGIGGGVYVDASLTQKGLSDQYVQAVAADSETSDAVKVAMVMGHYYESSGKHIGTPYIDTNGKGQPLTVCNGVTGRGVVAGRYYTPQACYNLEKGRYIEAERSTRSLLRNYETYGPLTKGALIDFTWNKGVGALATSTLRRKSDAGDKVGMCAEMPKWNKGTVNGVKVALPGLTGRGVANNEICATWDTPT